MKFNIRRWALIGVLGAVLAIGAAFGPAVYDNLATVTTSASSQILGSLRATAYAADTYLAALSGRYVQFRSPNLAVGTDTTAGILTLSNGDTTGTSVTAAQLATMKTAAGGTALTSGRVPFATTGGALIDSSGFLFGTSTSVLTLGKVAASNSGKITLVGLTSGSITQTVADAAGSGTWTWPSATDTVVGKATTDTLTNKTLTTPTLSGGTLLVSPAQGQIQNDGVLQYYSPVTAVTALTPSVMYSIVPAANFTLQTASGVQSAFPTTGDVWTLAATTTYEFEGVYRITRGGTDNVTTAMAFACSSAPTSIIYSALMQQVAANTTGVTTANTYVDQVSTTVICATSTATAAYITFKGILRTNGATTVTPQIDFSGTVTTPVMVTGSRIRFTPLGTSTTNVLGSVG